MEVKQGSLSSCAPVTVLAVPAVQEGKLVLTAELPVPRKIGWQSTQLQASVCQIQREEQFYFRAPLLHATFNQKIGLSSSQKYQESDEFN